MTPIRSTTLIAVAILAGCAGNPPVQPAANNKSQFEGSIFPGEVNELANATPGSEVFRAFHQGGSGFVSLGTVRRGVEKMADKHCARLGKVPRPIQETTSKPPHILGNFPRVELLFECTDPPSPNSARATGVDKVERLERLKKLLDNGALTQQEYDLEKAELLSTRDVQSVTKPELLRQPAPVR